MKTFVVRDVDGQFFTADGSALLVHPNKFEGEQQALRLASAEPQVKFRLVTISDKFYCVDPSIIWSTPEMPEAWRTQSWKAGWYELWQMKNDEKCGMSSVLLVLHTPEHGPGMLKHVQFSLTGAPNCQTSTNFRPIRAFKVSFPSFSA